MQTFRPFLLHFAPFSKTLKNWTPTQFRFISLQVSHLRSNLSVSRGFSGSSSSLNTIPAPPLASQLALFSRELVDLLKTSPGCKMPFHKFIPMYHHFFGRQCRVADYGYTKLKDLFEALPHVVQIIGEGKLLRGGKWAEKGRKCIE